MFVCLFWFDYYNRRTKEYFFFSSYPELEESCFNNIDLKFDYNNRSFTFSKNIKKEIKYAKRSF